MKIDICEEQRKLDDRRKVLNKEISEINSQIEELEKELDEAAAEDNEPLYLKLSEKISKAKARIRMRETQLDKLPVTVDPELVKRSWTDYAAEYNKKFTAEVQAYTSLKAEMLQHFEKLVELQREAMKKKKQHGELMTGKCISAFDTMDEIFPELSMQFFPRYSLGDKNVLTFGGKNYYPDTAFYIASVSQDKRGVASKTLQGRFVAF